MKRTITQTFREEAAQVTLSSNQPRKIIAADFGIGGHQYLAQYNP